MANRNDPPKKPPFHNRENAEEQGQPSAPKPGSSGLDKLRNLIQQRQNAGGEGQPTPTATQTQPKPRLMVTARRKSSVEKNVSVQCPQCGTTNTKTVPQGLEELACEACGAKIPLG
ncbi:MAG TPA: hypothetical protein PKW33_10205 [Anaerolineaceae bacterium]|nr:hypothetical protein [Anaerolineaceae bacterium]HPN51948.1 hypothetical protein [Anaerolineaceae bacterium]